MKDPTAELSIHGVEKTDETGRLYRINLAVHGLEGDIRHGGQCQQLLRRPAQRNGRFDFVLANPPFNVNAAGQGTFERHPIGRKPPLPLRPAAHRQRELSLDSALLLGAQGPSRSGHPWSRRVCDGELRVRRPLPPSGKSGKTSSKAAPQKITNRTVDKAFEIYLCLYQAVTGTAAFLFMR